MNLSNQMSEDAELLQALIRNACVNDGFERGNEVANADAVLAVIDGCGADIEVFDSAPGRRSVIARIPGTDPDAPTLMMLGHSDVVPAQADRWTHDPFGGENVDGFIWGRGSLDMLGQVTTMSLAFRDQARSGQAPHGDVVLAVVADEEALGQNGTAWLLENHADAMQADWVISEAGGSISDSPTGERVGVNVAEKGVWRLRLHVLGSPGHSSLPYSSANALILASRVCVQLADFEPGVVITDPWRQFVTEGWPDPSHAYLLNAAKIDLALPHFPDLAGKIAHAMTRMTLVVTSISSDASWNIVPGRATIEIDVRTLQGQGLPDIMDVLDTALGELREQVSIEVVAGTGANVSPTGTQLWGLLESAMQVHHSGTRLLPLMSAGVTDARFFRHKGVTSYGVGIFSREFPTAEIPSMMHGDDERIDHASLRLMRGLWSTVLSMHASVEHQSR
jgi:acetylornithine deacetylase/succinyl-diaminopimelate desuccinylase-like protein